MVLRNHLTEDVIQQSLIIYLKIMRFKHCCPKLYSYLTLAEPPHAMQAGRLQLFRVDEQSVSFASSIMLPCHVPHRQFCETRFLQKQNALACSMICSPARSTHPPCVELATATGAYSVRLASQNEKTLTLIADASPTSYKLAAIEARVQLRCCS